jgi:hypothetical protein
LPPALGASEPGELRFGPRVVGFPHRQGIDKPGFWPWQDLYADALVTLDRVSEADAFLHPHESRAAERGRRSMMLAASGSRLPFANGAPIDSAAVPESTGSIAGARRQFEAAGGGLARQSACFGSRRPAVRIRPARPHRKVEEV